MRLHVFPDKPEVGAAAARDAAGHPAMGSRRVIAGLAVVTVVALAGCGPDTPTKTFIVAGTVRLTGQADVHSGQPCAGTGGQADLRDGAEVVVSGPGGRRLGVGHLVNGVGSTEVAGSVSCVWDFYVPDVDARAEYYDVELTHRGTHRYSTSEIHGRIELTVASG